MRMYIILAILLTTIAFGLNHSNVLSSVSAAEFNGVEYEMPDGVDLTQEFQLLEKFQKFGGRYLTGVDGTAGQKTSDDFISLDQLFETSDVRNLWQKRWNTQFAAFPSNTQREKENRDKSDVAVDDPRLRFCYISSGAFPCDVVPLGKERTLQGWGIRDGNRTEGSHFYAVVFSNCDQVKTPDDWNRPCSLRYVFLGQCVVRDASGSIPEVKPTGSIFIFDPSEQNMLKMYVNLKEGKLNGSSYVWSMRVASPATTESNSEGNANKENVSTNKPSAYLLCHWKICEERQVNIDTSPLMKEYQETKKTADPFSPEQTSVLHGDGYIQLQMIRDVSSNVGLSIPDKNSSQSVWGGLAKAEIESRYLDARDYWVPFREYPLTGSFFIQTPPYPRKYHIVAP